MLEVPWIVAAGARCRRWPGDDSRRSATERSGQTPGGQRLQPKSLRSLCTTDVRDLWSALHSSHHETAWAQRRPTIHEPLTLARSQRTKWAADRGVGFAVFANTRHHPRMTTQACGSGIRVEWPWWAKTSAHLEYLDRSVSWLAEQINVAPLELAHSLDRVRHADFGVEDSHIVIRVATQFNWPLAYLYDVCAAYPPATGIRLDFSPIRRARAVLTPIGAVHRAPDHPLSRFSLVICGGWKLW